MNFGGIVSVIFAFVPIYLFAYGIGNLENNTSFVRTRFWVGVIFGGFSASLLYGISHYNPDPWITLLFLPIFFIAILFLIIWIFLLFGSDFAQGFLRKMTLIHAFGILALLFLTILLSLFLSGSAQGALLLFPVFFAAFFEETAKHLTTVGLLSRDFRFSLRDLSFFTFFIVLGFVFFENIFYIFQEGISPLAVVFRSFFVLSVHLFAAMICTFFWWKALSYSFFSFRYLFYFFLGFLLATGVHAFYNHSLEVGYGWIMVPYLIGAYMLFTWNIRQS